MEAFILILMIAGAGITIAAVKSAGGNADAVWRAASQRLGLRFTRNDLSDSPAISGTRRGLSVRIDTYAKSEDAHRTYTRYRVKFEQNLGLGLQLKCREPATRYTRTRGMPNVLTGDDDFDAVAVTKGHDPQEVVEFLTSARRRQVARFLTLCPGTTIDDVKIESETRDLERSPDRIVQLILRMTSLAEHLAVDDDADDDADDDHLESKTQPDEPETDRHFIGLPYAPQPGPISLEDMLQVEDEPAESTESHQSFVETPAVIDEEVFVEDIQQESNEADASSSDDESLSIETVVQTLFAQNQTTSQATELFERTFKTHAVIWSGTLLNVRSYRFDLVFGDVPGTRAELELLKSEDTGAVGRPIKAVVQCPIEVEDNLRSLVDRRVAFQGVLLSCDVFLKTLFVADGQIDEVHA